MPSNPDDFREYYLLGSELLAASRYEDAASALERALHTKEGLDTERLIVQEELAGCYVMLGRFPEAIANLGEVYVAARNRPELHYLAFKAFYQQVETIRCMQEAEGNETKDKVDIRLKLVDEGLRWLRDTDLMEWRHVLLFQKAIALSALGEEDRALDTIEQAYRLKRRFGGPGYDVSDYAWRVAKHARLAGRYERGLEVLDEVEGRHTLPIIRHKILVERAMLLRSLTPPRVIEALEEARRAVEMLRQVQHSRMVMFTYTELARAAAALGSYAEAGEALAALRQVCIEDQTFNQAFVVRGTIQCLQELRDSLSDQTSPAGKRLYKTVLQLEMEIGLLQKASIP